MYGAKARRAVSWVGAAWPVFLLALAGLLASVVPVSAEELSGVLAKHPVSSVFPAANHAGPVEGTPPSAPVFQGNKLVGYVFLTSDVVESAGYSGKPVKILVGLDVDGKITGAQVIAHQEPILVLGIPESRLTQFVGQFRGIDVRRRVRLDRTRGPSEIAVDRISGASITSLVFSDSILRSARLVARARGIIGPGPSRPGQRVIDMDAFVKKDWKELLADGSIRRLRLTNREVAQAFGPPQAGAAVPRRDPDQVFIDLYAALATPATIGQNLLGFTAYNKLRADLEPGAQAIWVGGRGFYSFRGYSFRRTGVFDRLQLVQGNRTLRLTRDMHRPVKKIHAAGAPDLREVSLFIIPASASFDPARPWRLELLAERVTAGGGANLAIFPLNYELPAAYSRGTGGPDVEAESLARPLWQIRWIESAPQVVALALILTALLALLVLQDWVVRHSTLARWLRLGFLIVTLIYLGWIALAQLSVINVLTFVNALLTGFRWDFFLLEPLIFILWSFVAVALLFWGRGVFCGWLCPFGALQELLHRGAVKLGVRQLVIPFAVNERLWPIKYIIFLGLLALSLGPVALAERMAEVEPFKTAIVLKFMRAWPFVAYAAAVLAGSLFVERVFCRYLCPLGAALAIPSRTRMFEWLKRRRQCGTECHICAQKCPVQAIHPNGRINPHECIYCLDCQQIYYDAYRCPPLIDRRKRKEERARLARKARRGEAKA